MDLFTTARYFRDTRFELASSQELQRDALRFRNVVYVDKGLLSPEHSWAQDDRLPSAVFVATRESRVVGTLSAYRDGDVGLPMETAHASEVRMMKARFRSVAEVGGFAVSEGQAMTGTALILFCMAHDWLTANGIEGVVACSHPSAARVYRSLLMFEALGPTQHHAGFRGALSKPLGLDLRAVPNRFWNSLAARLNGLQEGSFIPHCPEEQAA